MQSKKSHQILTPLQKESLNIFFSLPEANNFYLTGGTALAAFYLQHRLSEDLDIFTREERLIRYVGDQFIEKLKEANFQVETVRRFLSFLELIIKKESQSVRVHLAIDSPFRFERTIRTDAGVEVDSLVDIATNKLLALFGRFEPRDFIDVFFIVKEKHLDLDALISKSKEKDPGLDEYYLAIAFEKADEFPDSVERMPVNMLKPLDMRELKSFFSEYAVQLLKKTRE